MYNFFDMVELNSSYIGDETSVFIGTFLLLTNQSTRTRRRSTDQFSLVARVFFVCIGDGRVVVRSRRPILIKVEVFSSCGNAYSSHLKRTMHTCFS